MQAELTSCAEPSVCPAGGPPWASGALGGGAEGTAWHFPGHVPGQEAPPPEVSELDWFTIQERCWTTPRVHLIQHSVPSSGQIERSERVSTMMHEMKEVGREHVAAGWIL